MSRTPHEKPKGGYGIFYPWIFNTLFFENTAGFATMTWHIHFPLILAQPGKTDVPGIHDAALLHGGQAHQ